MTHVRQALLSTAFEPDEWAYTERDCALYALGLGCTADQPHR